MITARCIIEMVGSPKEHVIDTMNKFVDGLKKEKRLTVVSSTVAEPAVQGNFFSTYAELEARFSDVPALLSFCFDAMPSSIEILEPSTIPFKSEDLTNLLNDLQAKLHALDMDMKLLNAKNIVLDKNGLTMFRNFVKYALESGGKTLGELSNLCGIIEDDLQPFMTKLLDSGEFSLKKGVFTNVRTTTPSHP